MSRGSDKLPTRRQVLTMGAAQAVGVLTATVANAAEPGPLQPTLHRPYRWGMAIDLDRCTRCQACVVACAAENNVPPLGAEKAALTRPIHWMEILVPDAESSAVTELGRGPFPIPCMHCDRPECVKVCPVGATQRSDDGIVSQIWDRCIGCRYCMVACPYSRRYFNWTAPTWPGGDPSSANPDVALRPAGVVEKCTLCQHRIRAVVERALLDGESVIDEAVRWLPACASACPPHAITFGDLADPHSALSALARDPRAVRLLGRLGTEPKVFYLRTRR
jgi:molybdopterin-containing oxidoreductase family iron-sulfur binding subunit